MLLTSPSPVFCLELLFLTLFKLHPCGLARVSHGISMVILCYLAHLLPHLPLKVCSLRLGVFILLIIFHSWQKSSYECTNSPAYSTKHAQI